VTIEGEGGWRSGRPRHDRSQDPAAWPELMAALDWLPMATLVLAADGSAVAVSGAWVALSGAARGDSQGDGWLKAVDPTDRATLRSRLRGAAAVGETGSADFRLATSAARGWSRWWWRPDPGGRLVVCVARVGDHEPRGHDLWQGAVHGSAGRLVARGDFLNLAGRALRRRKWTGAAVAVVAVGLEDVTGTSATTGQPASDQVLRAAGERILGAVGPADVAALAGSGEVAILCGDLRDPGEAHTIVRRIREAMAQSLDVGGVSFSVVTATGVAVASAPGDSAETLISAAARAMRAARGVQATGLQASTPASPASAVYPPPGRGDDIEPPDDHLAQPMPQVRPDHELDAAVSLLDSVTAHALQAGLALLNMRPGGPEAAAVDRALGQLEEIVREARVLAFQLRSADTRIRPLGPERRGENGAG
jgi:GGDEF domain-containing protein